MSAFNLNHEAPVELYLLWFPHALTHSYSLKRYNTNETILLYTLCASYAYTEGSSIAQSVGYKIK